MAGRFRTWRQPSSMVRFMRASSATASVAYGEITCLKAYLEHGINLREGGAM